MPVVRSSDVGEVGIQYQLGLALKGNVKHIAAFIPADDGGSMEVIITNLKAQGKVTSTGLQMTGDMRAPGGLIPSEYGNGVKVKFHLCGKKTCKAKKTPPELHLGEWAYLAKGDDGSGHPLLSALVAAKQVTQAPGVSPPEGSQAPLDFDLPTPRGAASQFVTHTPKPKAGQGSPVVQWAEDNGVGVLGEMLVENGLTVSEIGGLAEVDVDAMFAAEQALPAGPKARFRLLVRSMRMQIDRREVEEEGSGWYVAGSGREISANLLRGVSLGGPECVLFDDLGVGVVRLPGQGLVSLSRAPLSPNVDTSQPMVAPAPAVFGQGGPLEEMAQTARALLARLGGTAAHDDSTGLPCSVQQMGARALPPTMNPPTTIPALQIPSAPHRTQQATAPVQQSPSIPPGVRPASPIEQQSQTIQPKSPTHWMSSVSQRVPARSVPLKVERSHAAAILAEWSNHGTVRLQEAVASRKWTNFDVKRGAFDMARALDVLQDSGLDLTAEPGCEVMLRAIAAAWYGDRNPEAQDVAEWLKESSMSNFGVPRCMLEEARAMKKLTTKAASSDKA